MYRAPSPTEGSFPYEGLTERPTTVYSEPHLRARAPHPEHHGDGARPYGSMYSAPQYYGSRPSDTFQDLDEFRPPGRPVDAVSVPARPPPSLLHCSEPVRSRMLLVPPRPGPSGPVSEPARLN